MADTLKNLLLDPDRRPAVVEDLAQFVDTEVASKGGASGIALKGGYGILKKINARFVPDTIDGMLEEFVAVMEPFYADFTVSGGDSLPDYLSSRSSETANALLGVTDARAENSRRESVKKVYRKLRPSAQKHVEAALPGLGEVIQRHAA